MTDYKEVSPYNLADAMISAAEEGMSSGFEGSKYIDGMSIEEWVIQYIQQMYDPEFAKDINERL